MVGNGRLPSPVKIPSRNSILGEQAPYFRFLTFQILPALNSISLLGNCRLVRIKCPVLLSTSQAQPGRTFSQLSNLSFAQPCSLLGNPGNPFLFLFLSHYGNLLLGGSVSSLWRDHLEPSLFDGNGAWDVGK